MKRLAILGAINQIAKDLIRSTAAVFSAAQEDLLLSEQPSSICNCLDWQPRWNLSPTIEKIVAWHRAHVQCASMGKLRLTQIDSY